MSNSPPWVQAMTVWVLATFILWHILEMSVEQETENDFNTEVKVENYQVEAILDFVFCNTDQVKI